MAFKKIKRLIKSIGPQSVSKVINIEGFKLNAPLAHQVEEHLKHHKYYSRNLPRVARFIENKYSEFIIIDVGANIGDSVALLRGAKVNQKIIAVEGETSYYSYLLENLAQFENVVPINTFLGEENRIENFAVNASIGTANLVVSDHATEFKKLDDLVADEKITNIKLLKIDTDGFDLKILRGSLKMIGDFQPIIFFEYDANYLDKQNEDGLSIFESLNKAGYGTAMFYDNFGKFLISLNVTETNQIAQLYAYMRKQEGAFPYFDVCVFHGNDDTLADDFIKSEMDFFN